MPIRLKCSCGKVLSVREESAGKAVKCPGCQATLRVPASAASAATATGKPPGAGQGPAKSAGPAKAAAAGRPAAGPSKPRAATKEPKTVAAGPAASTAEGSLDDLFSEAGFQLRAGKTCPSCFQSMPPDAVLCTQCGFNTATGDKIKGHVTQFEDEQASEAYLQRAARDMESARLMQEKMASGAGMPWWMLGLLLFLLASTTGVGVVAVNLSRRVGDDAVTFDAIGTLLTLAAFAMWAVAIGAQLVIIYRACMESAKQGLMVLFVPLYILYYCITRFSQVGKPMLLAIVAGAIAVGCFMAVAAR